MTAGGAQTALKAQGLRAGRPHGDGGYRAAALAAGGADPARRRARSRPSSTPRRARNWLRALLHLPDFVLSPYFAKGLGAAARGAGQGAGHPRVDTGRGRRQGQARARSSSAWAVRERRIAADLLLLHQGVVPNVNLAIAAGVAHAGTRASLLRARARRGFQQLRARHRRGGRRRRHRAAARRRPSAAASPPSPPCARSSPKRRVPDRTDRAASACSARRWAAPSSTRCTGRAERSASPRATPSVCRCEEVTARQVRDTVGDGLRGAEPDEGVPALRHGAVPGPAVRPHRHRADRRAARHDAGRGRLLPAAPAGEADHAGRAASLPTDRARRSKAVVPRNERAPPTSSSSAAACMAARRRCIWRCAA